MQDALRLFETPGQELQQLLPGFRRRHLQWFRHGIPLKNTASPPAEGELHVLRVAVPAQERMRADFHAARKPESPATLLTGGRLGKASDRLGLTIETDPMPAYKRFGG